MAIQVLKTFLFKTFGVQETEIRKTLLMQVNLFLIICASLIVKPIANGLFLAKFGIEQLPVAYLFVALIAGAVSLLYTRVLQRHSVVRIFGLTFVVSIFCLIIFGVALSLHILEGLFLYLLYIWIAIFALVSASQFWIVANFVFSAREAKRLFGLIGAGGIAGAIFGGYLTSFLANFLGSEYLLFLCALLLMACIPITMKVWKEHVESAQSPFERSRPTEFVASHPFLLIRKSRQLSFMAGIAFVSVLVAKLVDYQFSGLAVAAIDDPDALTAFFGFWFSTFNVISLLLQLFVTRKVVGTFGVGTALFFLPGALLLSAAFLLVFPELLLAAIFLKMTESSLKQSVHRAAMELLILPIPAQIKNQTKTFIDVFVDSVATGCTGLLLIFIVQGMDLPVWVVTAVIIVLGILWLRLAQRLRKEYVRTFSRRIEEASDLPSRRTKDAFDFSRASVLEGLRNVLKSGTETQMLYVLQKLLELKEDRLFAEVTALLDHPSDAVKVAALRYLNIFRKQSSALNTKIEPLMFSQSQDVKIQAFEYLIGHTLEQRTIIMDKYLNDPDYRVRVAAMVCLSMESGRNPDLKQSFGLEQLIGERYGWLAEVADPEEKRVRLQAILQAMGYARIPRFYPVIAEYLDHPDVAIFQAACAAAGHSSDAYFVPVLIHLLAEDGSKEAAIEALAQYGNGIIGSFRAYLESAENIPLVVRCFPAVAGQIPTRESLEFCFTLLTHEDAEVRSEAIQALNVLKQRYPDYRVDRSRTVNEIRKEAHLYQDTLSILYAQIRAGEREAALIEEANPLRQARQKLITLLEKKLDADLETIFQLLGLHYAENEFASVYKALKDDTHERRSDALEFLENLMEPNLKKILMPILEVASWESITEEMIRKMKIRVPGEYQCYKMILQGRNRRLKEAVLQLFRYLRNTDYNTLIDMAHRDADPRLRDYALKTWELINEESPL